MQPKKYFLKRKKKKKTILYTTASKRIKYLEKQSTKEVNDLYSEKSQNVTERN